MIWVLQSCQCILPKHSRVQTEAILVTTNGIFIEAMLYLLDPPATEVKHKGEGEGGGEQVKV